ncbi:hypothetical protein NECAME_14403 [Necator americanus]|uniref:Uncharacterized protein n=1 Tax=Necator americanus TaxID=51031 RepID=W2SQ30_NECAM|nr:hypothetical protein NECAME_14403 [Necator americanus]ETN70986.1 hypothetical protein NECAME_14403 [Necator americanus]
MSDLMKTRAGRDELTAVFRLKVPLANISLTYNNIQHFFEVIFENFQYAVQYNKINRVRA